MLSIPTTCPYCACGCGFFLSGEGWRTGWRGAEQDSPGGGREDMLQGMERP